MERDGKGSTAWASVGCAYARPVCYDVPDFIVHDPVGISLITCEELIEIESCVGRGAAIERAGKDGQTNKPRLNECF